MGLNLHRPTLGADTSRIHVSLKQCCVLDPPKRMSLPCHDTALWPQL